MSEAAKVGAVVSGDECGDDTDNTDDGDDDWLHRDDGGRRGGEDATDSCGDNGIDGIDGIEGDATPRVVGDAICGLAV